MRAAVVLGFGFGLVSFVACGSANVDSVFTKDCKGDDDCTAPSTCKAGACVSPSSGGASGSGGATGSGGAASSGGETTSTGGISAGGSVSSGGTGNGGTLVGTGGVANTGGVVASGGSDNTGGESSGGAGSDAGTGGATGGGGASGTGGAQGTGGSSKGTGGSSTGGDGVYCGTRYCPEKQMCCYGIRGGMGFPMQSHTCSEDACSNTEVQIACSASRDCPASKKCCQVQGTLEAFQCLDECPTAEIRCTGPDVCKGDQVCCETTKGSGATETPTVTECASQCDGNNGSNEYILCHSNEDCPGRLPRCANSNLLPGFKRCWPAM